MRLGINCYVFSKKIIVSGSSATLKSWECCLKIIENQVDNNLKSDALKYNWLQSN